MTFYLLALAVALSVAQADIRQAPTMKDALADVDGQTLVIFDLDNTVMMPPQSLGGEEWYDYFVEKRAKEFERGGLPAAAAKEKAVDQGLAEWNQFHRQAKVVPVEADTPGLIQNIQKLGARTMALTARPLELADATVAQLKSIGIDLGKQSVASKPVKVGGKYPSLFKQGALLVGPKNNKGEVIAKFIRQLSLKPVKIVFVDNKIHHVENVGNALSPTGIPYFGRRHGAADQKIAAMDPAVVEIQHRFFFGEVLTNEQASKLK